MDSHAANTFHLLTKLLLMSSPIPSPFPPSLRPKTCCSCMSLVKTNLTLPLTPTCPPVLLSTQPQPLIIMEKRDLKITGEIKTRDGLPLKNAMHQQQTQNSQLSGPRRLTASSAPTHGGFPAPSALYVAPPSAPTKFNYESNGSFGIKIGAITKKLWPKQNRTENTQLFKILKLDSPIELARLETISHPLHLLHLSKPQTSIVGSWCFSILGFVQDLARNAPMSPALGLLLGAQASDGVMIDMASRCSEVTNDGGLSANHRGHHYYDLISHRIIISRHLVFDEDHFPYASFNASPPVSAYDDLVDDSYSSTLVFVVTPTQSTFLDSSQTSQVAPTTPGSAIPTATTSIPFDAPSTSEAPPAANATAGDDVTPGPSFSHAISSTHPMTTRSRTENLKPRQHLNLSTVDSISCIPTSTAQAVCDPCWREAMNSEISALLSNHTWDLVLPPASVNLIGSRWLYHHKFDSQCHLARYKARLVAQSFLSSLGLITTRPSVRLSNLLLFGNLPAMCTLSYPNHVCRLRKALYGLKQAPHAWFQRFAIFITSLGFSSSKSDSSLFVYHHGRDTIYLLLHVDDIILIDSSPDLVTRVISRLSSKFKMTDLVFAQEIISRDGMNTCHPCSTPSETKSKLPSSGAPVSDPTLYRSLAGALQYLTFTRPDIFYVVQQIYLFMHDPCEPHFNALKRILRYLQGTFSMGLFLRPSFIDRLVSYTDADWVGCPDTRRSTSRFCVFLGDNLVS
ncbi:hypothetical protein OSB04_021159 [Centaurea solstitialis]|uniref:Reverse transcriptase Ty1/copia-type domain-containing protein n=1 Tax=Centaurea solstitialis TaxID=347529 RepID=A0AA38WHI6_9ASTR|nr:hypothetical protein OSB04_021159 [Centaurea solstitialis]